MLRYFLVRIIGLLAVLLGMTVVLFGVTRFIPGDPAAAAAGSGAPKAVVEAYRRELGLDRPVHQQYSSYMRGLLHGDLGRSIISRTPVREELVKVLPASVELVLVAMSLSVPLGVVGGVVAAKNWGRKSDRFLRGLSTVGAAVPLFWLGLLGQLIFFRYLGWLPADQRLDFSISAPPSVTGLYLVDSLLAGDVKAFMSAVQHIALPAVVLAVNTVALLLRQSRASVLQVLGEDFIRTAYAKGLSGSTVLWRHALPNAFIPVLTEIGLQFGVVLGATFLVEFIFSWPGIGMYAVSAMNNLDYPAIMGAALLFSVVYVIANFVVDLMYPLVDPRVRESYGG